jgi:hypothetical protein
MTYEHKQVSVGITICDGQEMTRIRDWRERLFSWPWRPWVREVPSEWALVLQASERAREEMLGITGLSTFVTQRDAGA